MYHENVKIVKYNFEMINTSIQTDLNTVWLVGWEELSNLHHEYANLSITIMFNHHTHIYEDTLIIKKFTTKCQRLRTRIM